MPRTERANAGAGGTWLTALQAASLGYVLVLTIGTLFVIAVKLQYPNFGAGADPMEILTTIVILSLACLRAPVHIGGLTLTALPLGALFLAVLAIAWATRSAREDRVFGAVQAVRIGILFGFLCCLMALAFRYRGGPDPVHAGALGSFVWGAVWGSAGAALGLSHAPLSLRALAVRAWTLGGRGRDRVPAAVRSAVAMLGVAGVLSLGALLIWMIGALATGRLPRSFGVGDAVAGCLYFLAFAPNLMVAILSISLGASVDAGAQLTLSGKIVGPAKEFSMSTWGDGSTPEYVFVLVLIPLVICVIGGLVVGATTDNPRSALRATLIAALTFAGSLAVLAWLGEARLGASIVGSRGFGRLSVNPLEVFVAGLLWVGLVGGAAAMFAVRRPARAA
jgi:hypothetical protein